MNSSTLETQKQKIDTWLENNAQYFPYQLDDNLTLHTEFLSLTATDITDDTQIPFKFGKIENLVISFTHFKKLTHFPSNLEKIELIHSHFIELPPIPHSLIELNCSENYLTALPKLTPTLEYLNCRNNKLTTLSLDDAKSLKGLDYSQNPQLKIDHFPSTLQYLICEKNELTSLPTLPNGLEMLVVNYNSELMLDNLPSSLNTVNFIGCQLNKNNIKALLTLSPHATVVLNEEDFLLPREEIQIKNYQWLQKKWAKIEKEELEKNVSYHASHLGKIKL